jgi:hypothetical protein
VRGWLGTLGLVVVLVVGFGALLAANAWAQQRRTADDEDDGEDDYDPALKTASP